MRIDRCQAVNTAALAKLSHSFQCYGLTHVARPAGYSYFTFPQRF